MRVHALRSCISSLFSSSSFQIPFPLFLSLHGSYHPLGTQPPQLLGHLRRHGHRKLVYSLSFGSRRSSRRVVGATGHARHRFGRGGGHFGSGPRRTHQLCAGLLARTSGHLPIGRDKMGKDATDRPGGDRKERTFLPPSRGGFHLGGTIGAGRATTHQYSRGFVAHAPR